ncbi:activating transcription factor 7-interacting protein 1 [Drosophila simulans]|uniref:Uncharacterized protein, isoform B n=1 Tax=Drosophila simulans TaxID=7240 RepID=A0A0J9R9Y5_DROSI|nr:activating transcription factor 7-interacting protein 1 [Drosophila simulans]XP_016026947.1 activating transcription factor 7-interacting protein 1 [Drosophila simulans]XP_039147252.1 activating transcription factor 7-interacting protein 1 [Drosophila simulans]KMY92850.1 uncharacterized protein Dsimw501_GD25958, isoform B [Drosophila simulans]KMY92851.1 uncharacterized protein Dsimw501_GD25958, isoform C [Drosophila simulans]
MMGVSQNMELKELSTEEALMRTLSSELGNEVEPHSTPAILNESSRTSVDEVDLCELTNGVDSSDNVKVIDKPKKISDQERNPGSDLDALLDKISSIVDCSPKNSDDIDLLDRGEECDSVSAKKRTAGDTDKNLKEQKEKPEEEEQGEDVLSSLEGAECIDPDSELKTEEKLEENEEHASAKESTQKTEDLADSGEILKSKEEDEVAAHTADNIEKDGKNRSTEDVFMYALDCISSADEFDVFSSQDSKKVKPSKKLNTEDNSSANDLEDISSDDDDIIKENEKPNTEVIDLDSSSECVPCETESEVEETAANTEDTEVVTHGKVSAKKSLNLQSIISEKSASAVECEPVKADEHLTEGDEPMLVGDEVTEKSKESIPIQSEESMEIDEPDESKESEELQGQKEKEEPGYCKKAKDSEEAKDKEKPEMKTIQASKRADILGDTKGKEDPNPSQDVEDVKDTEEPENKKEIEQTGELEEPVVIEGEETEDPKKKVQKEFDARTQAQEMKYTTIDDLLVEAVRKVVGIEEKKVAEDEPEGDKEPTTNGVCEISTDGNLKHLESKESTAVEEETKETESDDEVIFFEPLEKTENVGTTANPTNENSVKPQAKDDEVVLVSEDEDETPQNKIPEKEVQTTQKETALKELSNESTTESGEAKDLQIDNSDNACDQFEKLKTPDVVKQTATEDGNSNSSNLLRPAEYTEDSAPKRLRLSTDEKNEFETETNQDASPKLSRAKDGLKDVTKRSHEHLDSSPQEEIPNKKARTEDSDSNSSHEGTLQIDMGGQDDKEESPKKEVEKKLDFDLNPVPEIKQNVKPLRLEFFKTFRRSFDTMTRDDLEELVLQKVVEAMMVKSDFAEIRMQLEKCESTLVNYRRKIAEVSKQFLDLETVHKRVLKDLEAKNSHFTAPVRITRAVGLQVGIPFKAIKPTVAAPEPTHAAGSVLAPPSGTPPKASTSPTRASVRPRPPPPPFGPSTSSSETGAGVSASQNSNPQQQQPAARSSPSLATASVTPPVRRGCLQKVTPHRPVPTNLQPGPMLTNQASVQRLQPPPPIAQRTTHASKHTGTPGSTTSAVANAINKSVMRGRMSAAAFLAQRQQQQQQQLQQQQAQQQFILPRPSSGPTPGASPAKQVPKCTTKVRAQQPPLSGATVSVPISSSSSGSGSGSYGQQQEPSLTPAKPKEKAVIDLTDEDDAAAAAAARAAQAQIEANARLRQASNAAIKRNAQTAAAIRGGRGGGNVVRASPMQLARVNARQLVHNNGGGQRSSLGSNVTMQIRSENTPPPASRLRYSHPAPLPTSPPQPFNPAWKVPPSRPVIRISLLETGIVISWTLEDSSPRFAECVMYQIYAYQETIHEPSTDSWRHVGDVSAMLLPMAVTLNQFQENQRYFFAVRGVDSHDRFGPFSVPKTWS